MKKLTWEEEPRCIAVMEPVERKTAIVLFDTEVCNQLSEDKKVEENLHVNLHTTVNRVGGTFCNPIVQCKHSFNVLNYFTFGNIQTPLNH